MIVNRENEQSECKGCSANVRITPKEIAYLFSDSFSVQDVKLVTEEIYKERIGRCLACPALQYGTTCQYCGCLIHIKAKLRASKCPYPYSPNW